LKRPVLVIAAFFLAIMFFYGAVAALVNQGHGLIHALLTFVLVGAGAGMLVWFARPDR